MKKFRHLLILLLIMTYSTAIAQKLSSHKWQDRIIIIQVNDPANQLLEKQLIELKKHKAGLDDRNLIVYQMIQNKYKKGFSNDGQWESTKDSDNIKQTDEEFEVLLIGLDGGIKLRKNEFISCQELFEVIDQMPMRQSEIRKGNKSDSLNHFE